MYCYQLSYKKMNYFGTVMEQTSGGWRAILSTPAQIVWVVASWSWNNPSSSVCDSSLELESTAHLLYGDSPEAESTPAHICVVVVWRWNQLQYICLVCDGSLEVVSTPAHRMCGDSLELESTPAHLVSDGS
jgi:hypothetical protein